MKFISSLNFGVTWRKKHGAIVYYLYVLNSQVVESAELDAIMQQDFQN